MGLKTGMSFSWGHISRHGSWRDPGHLCSCQGDDCSALESGKQLQTTTERGLRESGRAGVRNKQQIATENKL